MRAATSSPQIAEYLRELGACTDHAQAIAMGLTVDELARRPAEKSWSIAELLEHLSISTRGFLPGLDSAAAELRAKNLSGTGPYAFDWVGRLMIWSIEPPARFRMRAPGVFVPVDVGRPETALSTFVEMQDELVRRVLSLDGLPIDRVKIASPAARMLRYNVWSALKILSSHQRRHLGQAERVKLAIRAQ